MGAAQKELALPQLQSSTEERIPWNYNPRPLELRTTPTGNPNWQTLNGLWDFSMNPNRDQMNEGFENVDYTHKILVPFPFQAPLSGIGINEDIPSVRYRRTFTVPDEWSKDGRRTFLLVDRADYDARVYVNSTDTPVVTHQGGYTPFRAEITDTLKKGDENEILAHIIDDNQNKLQPRGKQSKILVQNGCFYTPMTGFGAPVSLLTVPETFVDERYYTSNMKDKSIEMKIGINGKEDGLKFNTKVLAEGKEVGNYDANASTTMQFAMPLSEIIPWDPRTHERPFRYDVVHTLYQKGGKEIDQVASKFGVREFKVEGNKFVLNGEPIFLKWILYQDYNPNSLYIAPDISDTERHLQMIKDLGFNGIRVHMNNTLLPHKLDEYGLLWSLESQNWNGVWIDDDKDRVYADPGYKYVIAKQYREQLEQHYNIASFVRAKPLNEIPKDQDPELIPYLHEVTKGVLGDTRPADDVSGFVRHDLDHTATLTKHYYTTDSEALSRDIARDVQNSNGLPVDIDEYGGVRTDPADGDIVKWSGGLIQIVSIDAQGKKTVTEHKIEGDVHEEWGYGEAPKTQEEAIERIANLTNAILNSEAAGYCYTQFNDTGKEHNGLFDAEGKAAKLPIEKLKEIFTQNPATETEGMLAAD